MRYYYFFAQIKMRYILAITVMHPAQGVQKNNTNQSLQKQEAIERGSSKTDKKTLVDTHTR